MPIMEFHNLIHYKCYYRISCVHSSYHIAMDIIFSFSWCLEICQKSPNPEISLPLVIMGRPLEILRNNSVSAPKDHEIQKLRIQLLPFNHKLFNGETSTLMYWISRIDSATRSSQIKYRAMAEREENLQRPRPHRRNRASRLKGWNSIQQLYQTQGLIQITIDSSHAK